MIQLQRFSHPLTRWLTVFIWTTLVIIILLKPGNNTVDYKLSFPYFISSFFSFEFNRNNLSEAFFHVFLFSVLTALWQWALVKHFTPSRVFILTIIITVILGIGTEIGQFFINRGSLLLDLMANILGIVIACIGFSHLTKL